MEVTGRNRVLVLVGILLTVMLAGLDNTIVTTIVQAALPELGGESLYAWTFAAYMLATAVSMPIWGPGSDRWGRKKTYLAGVAIFLVGSALCAAAPTMPLFIAARALQGIGAGALSSLPFIVLGVVFPPHMRGKALGVVSSAWAISSVAGPIMGSAIVSYTSWRWAFLINVPIAIVAGLLVLLAMPESHGDREGRFDIAGALLAGLGGSAIIYAFVDMGTSGVILRDELLVVAGVALLALFVWVESRTARPILPLSLFRNRPYALAMGSSLLLFFAAFGISAYLPLHTRQVFGEGMVGWAVGAFTIGWSGCAFAAGRLVHRVGERLLGLVGAVLFVLGLAALPWAFGQGLVVTCLVGALTGAGMGVCSPGLTVVVQNSVDVRRMGSATTSQQFVRQIGGAMGVSAFVLVATLSSFPRAILVAIAATVASAALLAMLPSHSVHGAAGATSAPAGEP